MRASCPIGRRPASPSSRRLRRRHRPRSPSAPFRPEACRRQPTISCNTVASGIDMAGYLIAVTFKSGGTGTPHVVLLGVDDGMFPDQATAIAGAKACVTSFWTDKDGVAPTNMSALVNQTR